jgi:synaptobrevin family protein YKT6|tara:strand:+ start:401 stop:919 length:519 start_codon:yes stop_codon:yes gene_type:complete
MKLVAAFIFEADKILYAEDLNFVTFFNRNSVRELMHELVRVVAAEVQDLRKIFEHPPWQFVVLKLQDKTLVMVTDNEYPTSVSYELLTKLAHDPTVLQNIILQCQDPRTISPLYRIRQQLDETMVIMHENVDKILQRSEDINKLVQKSERLSQTSKTFYKVARKHNRCCSIS